MAEGRPIWKPMHMQPIYRMNSFITAAGEGRARTNAYIAGGVEDVGADIFARSLCLPSDNKMTEEQQNVIIEVIKRCFEWFVYKGEKQYEKNKKFVFQTQRCESADDDLRRTGS